MPLLYSQVCAEGGCLDLTISEKAERNQQHCWESRPVSSLLLYPDQYARTCPIHSGAEISSVLFLKSSENYNIHLLALLNLLAQPCLQCWCELPWWYFCLGQWDLEPVQIHLVSSARKLLMLKYFMLIAYKPVIKKMQKVIYDTIQCLLLL